MNSGIYKITNTVNGKFYIGSTNNFDRRWNHNHLRLLRKNGKLYIIGLPVKHLDSRPFLNLLRKTRVRLVSDGD